MAEKRIVMVSDGPYGQTILYSDGTTAPVPAKDVDPEAPDEANPR